MKNLLLSFFFISIAFSGFSQVVTGVYKGKMEVDSPKYTVDFELTLKEKNGKLVGYCQRLFIVDDILYYNLVKVTARIADSVLIVEDDKSVSNNFKEKTSGVKTVMFFKIQTDHDTVSVMPGEWSTSRTKKFLPITGSVSVYREQNYLATQLYKRLEDQRLDKEMMFEEKPKPVLVSTTPKPQPTDVTSTATTQKNNTSSIQSKDTVASTSVAVNKPAVVTPTDNKQTTAATTKPAEQKPTGNNATNQPVVINNKPTAKDTVSNTSVVKNNPQPVVTQQTTATVNQQGNKPPTTNPVTTGNKPAVTSPGKDSVNKQTVAVNNPKQQTGNSTVVQPTTKPPASSTAPVANQQTVAASTKPADQKPTGNNTTTVTDPAINPFGQVITGNASGQPQASGKPPVINNPLLIKRQVEVIEALDVTEDSIVLSLYDNGEIDGDTVSVFLNNELVVSKVGLKASAFKKTIAINKGELIQLTLFAENLGSIPPNTGLLVISTGNERYQVHFSATLNKSSSIMIRRKE